MKDSDYIFLDHVDPKNYSYHKRNLKSGQSYIESPNWLKTKKATINPKNNHKEIFNYALIAFFHHRKTNNIQKESVILNLLLSTIIRKILL